MYVHHQGMEDQSAAKFETVGMSVFWPGCVCERGKYCTVLYIGSWCDETLLWKCFLWVESEFEEMLQDLCVGEGCVSVCVCVCRWDSVISNVCLYTSSLKSEMCAEVMCRKCLFLCAERGEIRLRLIILLLAVLKN